jgi:hypothetical protein
MRFSFLRSRNLDAEPDSSSLWQAPIAASSLSDAEVATPHWPASIHSPWHSRPPSCQVPSTCSSSHDTSPAHHITCSTFPTASPIPRLHWKFHPWHPPTQVMWPDDEECTKSTRPTRNPTSRIRKKNTERKRAASTQHVSPGEGVCTVYPKPSLHRNPSTSTA